MKKDQANNPSSIAVSSTKRLLPSGATTTAEYDPSTRRIEFTIPGKVIGKGRPHFVKKTGVAITPQQTRGYESLIRDVALPLMGGGQPWDGCVYVRIVAKYKIPKSWSKKDVLLGFVVNTLCCRCLRIWLRELFWRFRAVTRS